MKQQFFKTLYPTALVLLFISCGAEKNKIVEYFNDGRVKRELIVNRKGLKVDSTTEFYKSGMIKKITHYKDDILEGIEESFDSLGTLRQTRLYENGKLMTESIFDPSGDLIYDYQRLKLSALDTINLEIKSSIKQGSRILIEIEGNVASGNILPTVIGGTLYNIDRPNFFEINQIQDQETYHLPVFILVEDTTRVLLKTLELKSDKFI